MIFKIARNLTRQSRRLNGYSKYKQKLRNACPLWVLIALKVLDEPIADADNSVESNVVWDDLPNDHPIFKGQADDIPPPGTRLTGRFYDFETGKPLEDFFTEEE